VTDPEEEGASPVGTQALLGCGHRIRLPWDLAPEAAVADLLRHEQVCYAGVDRRGPSGMVPLSTAWLPFPQARR